MSEPVRTCVACRTRRPQQALIRLRRRSDGVVVPAMGRRTRGRSAYLCPSRPCFERALRKRALERALGHVKARSSEPTPSVPSPVPFSASASAPSPASSSARRPHRVCCPDLQALWPMVAAALHHEIQNMKRSGDISRSPRYDALEQLRRGLDAPGRSA